MRRILICLMLMPICGLGQTHRLMTFNIRYDNTSDTVNNWNYRKQQMVHMIEYYSPSVMGIQEGLVHQVQFIDDGLSKYQFIGVGRDDGATQGEYCAIFYDTTKLKMINTATFWLSDTPDTVSTGWDAALPRICTYGLFEDRQSGKQLWIFNTHFDHIGESARKESAGLIIKKIAQLNHQRLPVILMGDFNATPSEKPIKIISGHLTDALELSKNPLYGPNGTFNGFNNEEVIRRIDYFFTSGLEVIKYAHLDDRLDNNKHLSDHLPVLITVNLPANHKQ